MSDAPDEASKPHGVRSEREPHGEAALLLIESLLHALAARSALPLPVVVEIVQTALDAHGEICTDRGVPQRDQATFSLLAGIQNSLMIDRNC